MLFTRRRRILSAVLAILLAMATSPARSNSPRTLTVDDVLAMEDVGRVALALNGRYIVYEWLGSFADLPNKQTLYSYQSPSASAKLHVVDLAAPAPGRPLFVQDSEAGYWLGAVSPDETKVSVYSLAHDRVRAGVFDFVGGAITWFDFVPNYFWLQQSPVWITPDELVFATLSDGSLPSVVFRSGLTSRLSKLWRSAFSGASSATVLESSPSGISVADRFRPGTLVKVNARTGNVTPLADGYFYNLLLSHDGRYLAGLKEGGYIQPEPSSPATGLDSWIRRQLVVLDLNTSEMSEPCRTCNATLGTLAWSADDATLNFFAHPVGRPLEIGQLFSFSPRSRHLATRRVAGVRLACHEAWARPRPALSAAGGIFVFGAADQSNEQSIFSTTCEYPGRLDWYFVSSDAARPVNLTAKFKRVSGEPIGLLKDAIDVIADSQVWRVYANGKQRKISGKHVVTGSRLTELPTEQEQYVGAPTPLESTAVSVADGLLTIDIGSGKSKHSSTVGLNGRPLAISSSGRMAVYRRAQDNVTEITATHGGNSTPIVRFNEHLREIVFGRTISLSYDLNGSTISSCALLPPTWDRRVRYPLIAFVYPNAGAECYQIPTATYSSWNLQLLAAKGYIVLFPNTSKMHVRGANGPTAHITHAVEAAVNQAIEEGYADPARLGLLGVSQGYHSALQILTESHSFRAAVVANGISNFSSDYGSTALYKRLGLDSFGVGSMGRYENERSDNWMGAKPWEAPQKYVMNSPVFRADRISAPLLILHSDLDQFPLGQSEEMFTAMYRLRKRAAYVTYWGEGHENISPANIRDMWNRIPRWFADYLGERQAP